jgi:hypothetical protein
MVEHDNNAATLKRQGLYPCEAEIARRLLQSEKHWRRIASRLERQGLPKIDPMKGRFWLTIEALFRSRHGLGNAVSSQPDGKERCGSSCCIAMERTLKQARQVDRKALPTLEHGLGDRNRELREERNE